jgi:glycosyltransferase involved in cell wall biosynthesis
MDVDPLVSVGLPCYNRPEMLKRAIDCILNQTYKNIELIISNDASPNPEVYRMLDEYAAKDSRIRLWHQPVDLKVYGNYYFVQAQARGKYFMYMQDDDWWEKDSIELMVKDLEAHPDTALSIGRCCYEDVSGKKWWEFDFEPQNIIRFIYGEKIAFLWMGLWRTDILRQFDNSPVDIYGKDIIICAEAVLSYPFSYVNKLLYHKTIYHDKETKNMLEDPFCYFRMYGRMLKNIAFSKYVKDKKILVFLVPAAVAGLVRVYSAKILFTLPVDHPIRGGVRRLLRG